MPILNKEELAEFCAEIREDLATTPPLTQELIEILTALRQIGDTIQEEIDRRLKHLEDLANKL